MSRVLLIGIGNTARSDDAVGVRVVEGVAGRHPDVECLCVQQLAPELAERMAAADLVVLVDASLDADRVRVTDVSPGPAVAVTHLASPASLLSLCELAYGRRPGRCLLVEIPVSTLGFGEDLSAEAIASVDDATCVVERLVIPGRPSS